MFLNYHNIADNYVPNNLINAFPTKIAPSKLNPIEASKPYEEYNTKGELTGYFWRYGETLNLEFNIDGEITIDSDALVFKNHGVVPTENTIGKVGQRAYNILDLKSFTCKGYYSGKYVWIEDPEFTYPSNTDRSVYVSAEDYLKDKSAKITIYNFRMEPVCERITSASPIVIFEIDRELSNTLVKGIYYCKLEVFNETTSIVAFDSNDCNLLVK